MSSFVDITDCYPFVAYDTELTLCSIFTDAMCGVQTNVQNVSVFS
jgi:hypothetical protein